MFVLQLDQPELGLEHRDYFLQDETLPVGNMILSKKLFRYPETKYGDWFEIGHVTYRS